MPFPADSRVKDRNYPLSYPYITKGQFVHSGPMCLLQVDEGGDAVLNCVIGLLLMYKSSSMGKWIRLSPSTEKMLLFLMLMNFKDGNLIYRISSSTFTLFWSSYVIGTEQCLFDPPLLNVWAEFSHARLYPLSDHPQSLHHELFFDLNPLGWFLDYDDVLVMHYYMNV